MATTFGKRQKEKNRQDKRREKEAKRLQRKQERANRPPVEGDEDPDIAGIVPGPQPQLEDDWPLPDDEAAS
jgi:hypothetical protein